MMGMTIKDWQTGLSRRPCHTILMRESPYTGPGFELSWCDGLDDFEIEDWDRDAGDYHAHIKIPWTDLDALIAGLKAMRDSRATSH